MKQTQAQVLMLSALGLVTASCSSAKKEVKTKPNVIVILADDLGYGDVSAYGDSVTIQTPNIDRLANDGVCFTNGHATSATSTPSRYALLTGRYPWKKDGARILAGDAPLLIDTNTYTFPDMMRKAGYRTGAIGKWHLGIGAGHPNWNETIHPNANDIGFDFSCLIAATNDRVPTVFVENGAVLNLDPNDPIEVSYKHNFGNQPTARTHPELMTKMTYSHGHNGTVINGIPRIGFMKGGKAAIWDDENMAPFFRDKVRTWIGQDSAKPFFLYYGLHEPHVPRTPNGMFVGKSGMGRRGDAILEADWVVGQLMDYLEENNLLENTIVVFTSDNGPVLDDGYNDGAVDSLGNHNPMGGFRGGKYSLFEAGTRVPFFVYWKGHTVKHTSDALVNQIDLMASISKLIGADCPTDIDSKNYLDVFMGKSDAGRSNMIMEANRRLALRDHDYVLIPPYKGPSRNGTNNELGNLPQWTLFNMKADPAQQVEIQDQKPEVTKRLKDEFLKITKGYYNPKPAAIKLK